MFEFFMLALFGLAIGGAVAIAHTVWSRVCRGHW